MSKQNVTLARYEVSADEFYGPPTAKQVKIEAILKKAPIEKVLHSPQFMTDLLGPSRTWKIFKKQQDAINCALKRRNGLMCFAFEQKSGNRLFLAAHPKVFWAVDSNRPGNERHSYEIIQELAVSKLYFDIEFDYEFNSNSNGNRMMSNFLKIVNHNLKSEYNLDCFQDHILDLDSCNGVKFSHHVIYQIPNTAFQDNYAVGSFVKSICKELKEAHSCFATTGCEDEINKTGAKYGIPGNEVLELFIADHKGNVKIFCDECVYTKNRHFRLLGSSKCNKNTPLTISPTNKYQADSDMNFFLDSLISYFSTEVSRILEFKPVENMKKTSLRVVKTSEDLDSVPYGFIDKFVKALIAPNGRIRKKVFFSTTSSINYDILGYRFCENIKRHHKSNNIRIIVDLNVLKWFQKCHDPECGGFVSEGKGLGDEVKFIFEDDSDLVKDPILFDLSDIWSAVEDEETSDEFPSLGLTDAQFLDIVDCVEQAGPK